METTITHDIRISVETQYQDSLSHPEQSDFIFAYRVTIENLSIYTVQLLRRHWDVFDALEGFRTVEGEGVVGLKPCLEPHQTYSYVSGTNIFCGIGFMEGYYTMLRTADGTEFDVTIPRFVLQGRMLLN